MTRNPWVSGTTFVLVLAVLLFSNFAAFAAGTTGKKKVLGIRVNFKDKKAVTSKDMVTQRLQSAKNLFESFSYGKLTIEFEITPVLTLAKNRSAYNGSGLASAAEAAASKAGYKIGSYHIVGFFYQGGNVGAHATVGGKRFWAPNNAGSTLHEMGHNFNYQHQNAWDPTGSNPMGAGAGKNDPWQFMTNGVIHPEPMEKWRCKWIKDRYDITKDGQTTRRLYTFDRKNTAVANKYRTIRIHRKTNSLKHLWLGYRSLLHNKMNANGKNTSLRQGLAVYWQKQVSGSSFLLDMHPSTGHLDDHSLQPGETFSDTKGGVYITNLGRGGATPNEYLDVQINRGNFAGNKAPVPTWDLPSSWKKGVPLTIVLQGNDPDGDAVSVMWRFSDSNLSKNTNKTTVSHTWKANGTFTVTAMVSDMKGKTVKLKKTITITTNFPVFKWTGLATASWGNTDNWSPDDGYPHQKSEVAVWNNTFTGDHQAQFTTDKSVRSLLFPQSLSRGVTIGLLNPDTRLNLYNDGVNLANADQIVSLSGPGSLWLQSNQTWSVGTKAKLQIEANINLNDKTLMITTQSDVVLLGDILGAGSLKKNGVGTLTIGSVASYAGATDINAGVFNVQGTMGVVGNIAINQAATLTGAGMINAHVSIGGKAKLAPGDGLGTLTLTGGLNLAGELSIDVDPDASPSSDMLVLSGAITFESSARIVITHADADLSAGQVLHVFDTAIPGADGIKIMAALSKGLYWDNRLAVDGTLVVVDFDECAAEGNGSNCGVNAGCANIDEGFECFCLPGYAGDGLVCDDVDECSLGTDDCHPNASCTNTEGSFACECNPGYSGDGTFCEDIDECVLEAHDCHQDGSCTNSAGSYTCECNPGYEGDGVLCSDVDECADELDNCHENSTCINEPGSFTCACHAGFFGDGITCCGDQDGDTICDETDNCPTVLNDDQLNTDGDLLGDACECIEGIDCGDDNPCTDDSCDPTVGCVATPNTASCDDGNPCTETTCIAGTCTIIDTTHGCCFTDEDCGSPELRCQASDDTCVPVSCTPCGNGSLCGHESNACVDMNGTEFCTLSCDDPATQCPEGTLCTDIGQDTPNRQCMPISADCSCMPTKEKICLGNILHIRDSCGGVGEVLEDCGVNGCSHTGCCPEDARAVDGSCSPISREGPDPEVTPNLDVITIDGETTGCVSTRGSSSSSALPFFCFLGLLAWAVRRRQAHVYKPTTIP
jgi:autotransporter-associated beta strand protein